MKILETERTIIRQVTTDDAEFMLDLLNQPSFIKYIGDRNVRTVEQSADYIATRFLKSYQDFGFGFYIVELKTDHTPMGICGFVKRDSLPYADLGFAFLAQHEKKGYGFETAEALMKYGRDKLNLTRLLAITSQDNDASGKLLLKLGFKYDRLINQPHDTEELKLFSARNF